MILIFLQVVFVIVCIFLILVILLQSGKGGDVAAAFGGSGSQTAFGPRGAQKPLEKATVVAALLFMLLALLFSLPGVNRPSSVVREGASPTTIPTPGPAPSQAASPAASPVTSASPASSPAGADAKAAVSPAAKASPAASPAKK